VIAPRFAAHRTHRPSCRAGRHDLARGADAALNRRFMSHRTCIAALLLFAAASAPARAEVARDTSAVGRIREEAHALAPLVETPLAERFLEATASLPTIAPRRVFSDSARTRWWDEAGAAALPETTRARLVARTLDDRFYWTTRYGTPLAYARPLELLAQAGMKDVAGARIADFGYGTIGHLRLLASLGAEITGIEVDPLLPVLYGAPGDQGVIRGVAGKDGSVRLIHGQFPAQDSTAAAVGGGYQLFISKNTLKNGYIHPAEKVNPRMLVHLGVDDTTFVRTLHRILAPGGRAMIYNLSPAPSPPGQPYKPWADGRCPFPEALWKAAGFKVIVFDRDDSPAARRMGHALGWDQGSSPMDLEKDLFATYTLVEKPR